MESPKPARRDLIDLRPPLPPHLRGSAVLKMIQEEQPISMVPPKAVWPPPEASLEGRPHGFFTKVTRGPGGRPVEWPPRNEQGSTEDLSQQQVVSASPPQVPPPVPPRPANYPQATMEQIQQEQQNHQQLVSQQQQQQQRQQNENALNMTTTYPSGFKMRDQVPADNTQATVVTSQPAFKITQPMKRRGDDKWPPKGSVEPTQAQVREFIKPKKQDRDYSEFFAQNALPHNYAAYRPPPGTQHRLANGKEEDVGVSDM